MSLTELYIDTFKLQSMSRTPDSVGGYTESWADGVTFAGRLSLLSEVERMSDDKLTVFGSHKLYCDPSVVITEADRIKLGTRVFEVKAIQLPSNLSSGIGHQEITVLEVQ